MDILLNVSVYKHDSRSGCESTKSHTKLVSKVLGNTLAVHLLVRVRVLKAIAGRAIDLMRFVCACDEMFTSTRLRLSASMSGNQAEKY